MLLCLIAHGFKTTAMFRKKNVEVHRNVNKKKYANILSMAEIQTKNKYTWYLPIFTVTNSNKFGKIRIVWDVATVNKVSLNLMLLKGAGSAFDYACRWCERYVSCQRFLSMCNVNEEPSVFVVIVDDCLKCNSYPITCRFCRENLGIKFWWDSTQYKSWTWKCFWI